MTADEPAAKEEARLWRTLGRTSLVIGVLTGLLTLYFLARPLWRDDIHPVAAVSISEPEIAHMTFASYLKRLRLPTSEYRVSKLRHRGVFVQFKATAEGWGGQRLPMGWQLIDRGTNDVVAMNRDFLFAPDPSRTKDAGVWSFFVDLTGKRSRYLVDVQIFQPDGVVQLHHRASKPFPPFPA